MLTELLWCRAEGDIAEFMSGLEARAENTPVTPPNITRSLSHFYSYKFPATYSQSSMLISSGQCLQNL